MILTTQYIIFYKNEKYLLLFYVLLERFYKEFELKHLLCQLFRQSFIFNFFSTKIFTDYTLQPQNLFYYIS